MSECENCGREEPQEQEQCCSCDKHMCHKCPETCDTCGQNACHDCVHFDADTETITCQNCYLDFSVFKF